MSNVIQFLEAMGSNPAMTRLSARDYAATVAALDVDAEQRQALVDRDPAALNNLLGGRATMLCTLFPSEEEERQEDDGGEGDKPDDDEEIEQSSTGSVN